MQVAYFPESPRPKWLSPVVGLGNFDGLHRGHQQLVDEVRRRARERGGTSAVMIFDPHPPRVLRPDKAPPLLMTLDQKLAAFQRAGLEAVAVVRFTHELSRWEPELFVETVIVDWLRAAEVWVGANFLFGRDRSGTFTLLRALGEDRGFRVEKIDPVRYKDFVVSSTRVRHLVQEGRVDEAGSLLGHHYTIEGTVEHGDGRGRGLGFPTANLQTANELLPADGIYASIAIVDGACHRAVTSVGVRPTIGDGRSTVEAHLLDGEHALYGKTLRLAFVKWLRGQIRFDGLEALREQMGRDVAEASALFDHMDV
ncbi:MAG TPA: bifunctional riboflavin kinase/FAD synthetase [Vicinamibacterales bacterium]|jgi:riboflavin kinase/FMN adenylyltransferase|nr:bifunctional riboflavin kinase/FAD synthetase [Vicinamibacterales bacterium]